MLRRPDEAPGEPAPAERLAMIPGAPGYATVAFVPTAEGAHVLEPGTAEGSGAPPLGTVTAPPSERLTWTAAALEVGRSGGRIVPASGAGAEGSAHAGAVRGTDGAADGATDAAAARRARPSRALPMIVFALLATLAVAGWTARRVGGRP